MLRVPLNFSPAAVCSPQQLPWDKKKKLVVSSGHSFTFSFKIQVDLDEMNKTRVVVLGILMSG